MYTKMGSDRGLGSLPSLSLLFFPFFCFKLLVSIIYGRGSRFSFQQAGLKSDFLERQLIVLLFVLQENA
jgi:hypothetical protein